MGSGGPPHVVVEVGPGTVRRLDGRPGERLVDAMVGNSPDARDALDALDDPVALLDERPVAVPDLWRFLLRSAVGGRPTRLVLVHPSWWPQRRVDVVVEAASGIAENVLALARRELIESPTAVVIEVGHGLVAVSANDDVTVFGCTEVSEIVGLVGATPVTKVLLDAPAEVPGAARTALDLRKALWCHGIDAQDLDVVALARRIGRGAESGSSRKWRLTGVAAAVVTVALFLGLAAVSVTSATPPKTTAHEADSVPESLVEGRLAVSIPALWTVERITGGPGSHRMQVSSPVDPGIALHITQAYAPGADLAVAAGVLGRAVAGQPAGTFVDFTGTDEVAGRPAVTYREIRPGRVVRWVVVVDGATRISIGCQSAPGREEAIRDACEQAIRSARELQ